MAVNSIKVIFLMADVDYAVDAGGLKEPELRALAERFGVSEEVVLRYERARSAYKSLFEKQRHQARCEAGILMRERGDEYDVKKLGEEMEAALSRIQAAELENEITRDLDEAAAALRAVVDVPKPPTASGEGG